MWEPYKSRREEHGVQLYGTLAIARDDIDGRLVQYKRNFQFFDAPVALFIAIDRNLGPGQWADLGGYIHALAFLARGYGLDTCPQESWARMHRIVRAFVAMPPEQMLFCAVAIGYGDHAHPANSFRSPRAPVEEYCRFFGFDERDR
jgi:nitroreductase